MYAIYGGFKRSELLTVAKSKTEAIYKIYKNYIKRFPDAFFNVNMFYNWWYVDQGVFCYKVEKINMNW